MAFSIGRGTLLGVGYIRVEADTGGAEEKLGLLGKGLGLAAVGFTAVAAAGIGATMVTSKFNSEMLKVQTQAGASSADVKTLSADILNLKGAQQGPTALAESMYHLKSIGLDNVNAMKDLKVASDLASVGGSNLEATTNALGGAWRSGIKGAETFAMAAGTVNAIIGAGNMRMEDFVSAIGTGILPAAKTFGVSLNQIGASLALMTDEGVPATDAATRLKMSLSLLAAPSAVAEKQLEKIGLTGLQLANTMRGPTGLVGAIQLLHDHLQASGMTLSEQAILLSHAFGGGRSSSAILTMVNNVEVLHGKLEQINKTAGNLPEAIAAQQKTLSAQLKMIESASEASAIKIGGALIGPVTMFVTFLNSTLIPAVGKAGHVLEGMIPVARIKSDLASLTSGVSGFFAALTGSGPKGNVSGKTAPSALNATRLQVPGFTGTVPGGSAAASTRLQVPGTGVGQTTAQRLQIPTGAAKAGAGTWAPLAPDVSLWQKAGTVVRGVLSDVEKILTPVGKAFLSMKSVADQVLPVVIPAVVTLAKGVGQILLPALAIVGDFLTKSFVPALKNIGVIAQPLLGLLEPLAVAVGATLYGALVATGFILNSVVGPALVAVTKFLSDNRGVAAVLAGVLVLLNAQLVISKVEMVAGAVASRILGTWNLILSVQTKAVAVATQTATAATRAWALAQGLSTKAMTAAKPLLQDAVQQMIYLGRNIRGVASAGGQRVWSAISSGASAAGGALSTAASNAKTFAVNMGSAVASGAKAAWSGIVSGASAVGTAMATAAKSTWEFVVSAAAATGAALKQAAAFVIEKAAALASAVGEGILTAAQWLLNIAMDANPIGLIIAGIALLVGAIVWIATKTDWFQVAWRATWWAIQTAAVDTWHFLDRWVIQPIATAFSWLWTHAIAPALRFIVDGFFAMADSLLQAAVDMLGWIPGLGGKLKGAKKAFDSFRDGVNAALGGIQPKTVPVTVSFNGVPEGQITGHTYTSTTGFSYAQGGHIPTWLGKPNKDSVPILAMGGEFVVNKMATQKHRKLLEAINSNDLKAYATGGMVGFTGAASSDMALANRIDIAREVKKIASAYAHAYNASNGPRGLGWARTQVGMPYQWGGDGNPSWDCSGFMSAIESVMRGEAPHRRWATGAFSGPSAPPNWVLGAHAPFMIGITNAGVGHTAGTLMGTNVEMSVGGAKVGAGARGYNDPLFPAQYGLVGFDRGGWLRPGVTMAYNGTGRPERVVGPHGESGGDIHVHIENHGVIGSQHEMDNWLVSSLTDLKRRGRLRGIVVTAP